jgi:hypothetical protein
MANDYNGSFAQNNITYSTSYTYTVTPGDNFYKPMVFVKSTNKAANFVTPPANNEAFYVNAGNYSSLLLGTALSWAQAFYANNNLSQMVFVVFDDTGFPGSSTLLQASLDTVKPLAYFKFILSAVVADQVAFAGVCATDPLLTQCMISSADVNLLTVNQAGSVYTLCKAAGSDAVIDYNATATNGLMTQLGISLGVLNASGTPIGNPLDCRSVSQISPSGAGGVPLTAANITALQTQNVGYWWYVGNSTGFVTRYGPKTILGKVPGSLWFANYIDNVSAILAATMLTNPGSNWYTNNTTYQQLLGILAGQVAPFQEGSGTGLISGFTLTKAPFNKATMVSAGKITIANAWSGSYNDNVRSVLVQGNLTVSL